MASLSSADTATVRPSDYLRKGGGARERLRRRASAKVKLPHISVRLGEEFGSRGGLTAPLDPYKETLDIFHRHSKSFDSDRGGDRDDIAAALALVNTPAKAAAARRIELREKREEYKTRVHAMREHVRTIAADHTMNLLLRYECCNGTWSDMPSHSN